jgi:hypothetical protein
MVDLVKKLVGTLPVVGQFASERGQPVADVPAGPELRRRRPPGHFYSPVPSLEQVRRDEERITAIPREIPGVDLREEAQLQLLRELQAYYEELPFTSRETDGLRYHYENVFYRYSDAIFLFCMMRHFKPKRIVEVGSGYTSCVMLDTDERFLDNSTEFTFIEPFPYRLQSLLWEGDEERIELLQERVQDVPVARFDQLGDGDFLFVDSSHVSKVGSDVNHVLFETLPRLNRGVLPHFHDVAYPFEYPIDAIYEGEAWNECYLVRAFLQYNQRFEIMAFNTFLQRFHRRWFEEEMPLCLKAVGCSLWLRKL